MPRRAAGPRDGMDAGPAAPVNINTSPDGKTLYLRRSANSICIYDVEAQVCTGVFTGARSRLSAF